MSCLLLIVQAGYGQIKTEAVRLTGIVLDADSREAVPYVNIHIKGTQYGTSSDNSGYFSMFINPGDTLEFTSIGYKVATFVMPFRLGATSYSLVQLMVKETLVLKEVVVFPWPTLENFERAFLDTKVKESTTETLVKEVKLNISEMSEDAELTPEEAEQMRYQRLYELHGTMPPNNFLNPMRWTNFIRDLKKGKKQEEEE